jgi:hypothetical protein
MRVAKIRITRELLRDALALPESARVLEVRQNSLIEGGSIEIVVEDDALPEVPEGNYLRELSPTFTSVPKFLDWGLK